MAARLLPAVKLNNSAVISYSTSGKSSNARTLWVVMLRQVIYAIRSSKAETKVRGTKQSISQSCPVKEQWKFTEVTKAGC